MGVRYGPRREHRDGQRATPPVPSRSSACGRSSPGSSASRSSLVILDLLGVDVIGLAAEPLGSDQGHADGLHGGGAHVPDRANAVRRALVLRDPQVRLQGRGSVLADRSRLRRRRGDERLPARQHRDVRDARHVRRDHPVMQDRGRDRRLPRPEDLLHARRDVRLPLHVPQRPRRVRHQLRPAPRPPVGHRAHRGRRRSFSA